MATAGIRGRSSIAAAWLFALVGAGCGETTPTVPTFGPDELRAALTPEVAALLDANGRLPVARGTPAMAGISEARATELALHHWSWTQPGLSEPRLRERPQGYARELQSCGPAYYTGSAYEQPLHPALTEYNRIWYAGHWLVRLCHQGRQHAVYIVSERAGDVRIANEGWFEGEMWEQKILPRGVHSDALPISPEAGAVAIARVFGVRVSAVPVLRQRPGFRPESMLGSAWYYSLERPIVIEGRETKYPREVTEIGIGYEHELDRGYDYLVDWNRPYFVVPNPWYVNEWRGHRVYHWDDSARRCCLTSTITRRADVAVHDEIIRAVPR